MRTFKRPIGRTKKTLVGYEAPPDVRKPSTGSA